MMEGACVYGELNARSTKFRAPWMSTSKDAIDMLKLTFQAACVRVCVSRGTDHSRSCLTVEHDVCDGRPDLLEDRWLEPEVVLVQHCLDHDELRRVQQRLVQATGLELCTLTLQRLSALAIERVHLPDRLVPEEMLESVTTETAGGSSDDDDLFTNRTRYEIRGPGREVRGVLLDVLPQVSRGV